MINFRPVEIEKDYPTLQQWWKGHNALEVPREILPRGWIAQEGSCELAASFLYVAEGKIAVIEWTTTNPKCSFSRDLIFAVKGLFSLLESVAREEGCAAVISFVKPNGSEQRIVSKMGYVTSTDDVGHRLYAKPLKNEAAWNPPEGGVIQCL